MELIPGRIYRRTDLHRHFGGQRQGGISTPSGQPVILLFTGYGGVQHGYADGWSDGVYCYFGEGQVGPMPWVRGNLAIRDHAERGRDLLLFEMLRAPRSHVRFAGTFAVASWEYRQAPDKNDEMRQAIVFHLVPLSTEITRPSKPGIADARALRQAAVSSGSDAPTRRVRDALVTYMQRSAAVRNYALARAAGHCERCGAVGPFQTEEGVPYLEVHHIRRLSDGGPDRPDAVAALCPNCHREAHYGNDCQQLNQSLLKTVAERERTLTSEGEEN